ncbi:MULTISPECIES: cell division protein FtsL [Apilactobacillus]|uniref:Cell division protein FtsL n=2 Tax=Apilactobacillus TaxID=2767877 RepID=A0A9Q8INE6_9LACO|nr:MULTISPECIES: cell division protein FtsL [Apilactobacillus]TPR13755.1 cell division protein FtsL [Apilactobacillus timberlakei]TPR15070.1 cell division protein FtsL [Apilactobacillus timberlakei]TPR16962.1 cell division protein FtsL [Apilactobacillus timberlakei]TPR17365.1 cell division protein FtsL [Apilactobacillus timberlakei]TPR19890.1 cell division protein FtsL [Apilactobacillus timberlakei]
MSQNNLARKKYNNFYNGNTNKKKNINSTEKISLSLSKFEKVLLVTGSVIVFTLMLCLVGEKISLSNHSTSLQSVENSLNKVNSDNNYLKQEIGELESGNRLQSVAKKANLSLSNKNVRNVNK